MFFASTAPTLQRRHVYSPAGRSLERFLGEALQTPRQQASSVEQDDKSVTLTFDVPGIAKDQLGIGIEGNIVRIQSWIVAPGEPSACTRAPPVVRSTSSTE